MIKKVMLMGCALMLFISQLVLADRVNTPANLLFTFSDAGDSLTLTTTKPGWFYPNAGVISLTPGFSFSGCTPNSDGFCLFPVSDTAPATIGIAGPAIVPTFKTCLNGFAGGYSCESVNIGNRFALVTNINNNQTLLCQVKTSGLFGTCIPSGLSTNSGTNQQIVINQAGTLAYVTANGSGSGVFVCSIKQDGTFGMCNDSGVGPSPFNIPIGITLNSQGTIAYVVNQGNNSNGASVSVCAINSSGFFSSCLPTGNGFSGPAGIVLNRAGTIAYVTDALNKVFMCPILSNGSFGVCVDSGNSGVAFVAPEGIVLNAAGTIAYVANNNDAISVCPINTNGSFGTCTSARSALFDEPLGITLNVDGTFAYIANASSVSVCPVNTDGSLGTCFDSASSGTPFGTPLFVTLF